jgi:hypothetical protein
MVTLADGFVLNGSSSTNELLCTKLRLVKYSHLFPGHENIPYLTICDEIITEIMKRVGDEVGMMKTMTKEQQ